MENRSINFRQIELLNFVLCNIAGAEGVGFCNLCHLMCRFCNSETHPACEWYLPGKEQIDALLILLFQPGYMSWEVLFYFLEGSEVGDREQK